MHLDLAHAIGTALLMSGVILLYRKVRGPRVEGQGFDWGLFGVMLVVMFVFNLIWPYSH